MGDVISFRPTEEEMATLDATRKLRGLETRAEALRYLLARARPTRENMAPLLSFRLPKRFQAKGRSITPREIDETIARQAYAGLKKRSRRK